MKRTLAVVLAVAFIPILAAQAERKLVNPAIDMDGFLRISKQAAEHRQSRRLTEEQFLKMAAEPGTIVLDARSKAKFEPRGKSSKRGHRRGWRWDCRF